MTTDKPLSAEESLEFAKVILREKARDSRNTANMLRDPLNVALYNRSADLCEKAVSEIDRLNAEREGVRDAALEEAAVKCLATADEGLGPHYFAEIIRSLKSTPK